MKPREKLPANALPDSALHSKLDMTKNVLLTKLLDIELTANAIEAFVTDTKNPLPNIGLMVKYLKTIKESLDARWPKQMKTDHYVPPSSKKKII
jgi:hypothetical protein